MQRCSRPTALLLAALAGVTGTAFGCPAGETAAPRRLELAPCELPGIDAEARCGSYEVFEDREARRGRTIALRVVVLPATGGDPLPDPIVYFAGGPGASAVEEGPEMAYLLADLRRQRDLVLIDVRGTGGSNRLACPHQEGERGIEEALESFLPVDEIPACREALARRADLRQYTTPILVDDVDEVRAALGYQRVNLFGGSYGTRAALVYLRRHPEAVRSAVLMGVAPTGVRMPLTFARDTEEALAALFAECAADADCHRAFPDPRADLEAALAALAAGPVTVPADGTAGELRLSRNAFVQTLRYMLYRPVAALQIPAFLAAAAGGEFRPLAETAYGFAGRLMNSVPDGLYLSVTCTEDVAWIDPGEVAAATAGTFLGDFRVRQQMAACAHWVRGELPAGYAEPVASRVPALILSGERDPATPVRWGEEVARHLPASRHLVVPDAGHSFFGLEGAGCVGELVTEFIRRGSGEGLAIEACAASIRRPPFQLR